MGHYTGQIWLLGKSNVRHACFIADSYTSFFSSNNPTPPTLYIDLPKLQPILTPPHHPLTTFATFATPTPSTKAIVLIHSFPSLISLASSNHLWLPSAKHWSFPKFSALFKKILFVFSHGCCPHNLLSLIPNHSPLVILHHTSHLQWQEHKLWGQSHKFYPIL